MASYNVVLRKSVAEDLAALSKDDLARVMSCIGELASDPFPDVCEKLSAKERYRVRAGELRIVYEVVRGSSVVIIVKVSGTPPVH